ncbi:MAG: radical SAM protein [Planctomycetes bacterium]|nr:radical SAM protein [Planctomycetota bacterium]
MIKSIFLFTRDYHTGLLRGTLTFIDNTLVYFFDKKPRRGPLFVNWVITYKCNAKCSFCNTHELDKALQESMTTEETLRIVREIGESGTWHLSLTGGETLLRKDLDLIIVEAKKYGMFVNLNTNGFLLERKAKMLVNSGADSIIISLDSNQANIHDEIRGIPGLTQALVNGIESVKSLRKRKKPAITLRVVVSKLNYKSLDNIINVFKPKVDKIFFQPIHDGVSIPKFSTKDTTPASNSLFHVKNTKSYMFEAKDRKRFADVFNALIKKHKWLDNLYHREVETFLFDKDTMWDKYKCYAGYYYMVLDPLGRAFPCTFLHSSLDNLRERSVMDVWSGEETKKWRKLIKNKENMCMCWCGISEVNAFLTNKFENKSMQLLQT